MKFKRSDIIRGVYRIPEIRCESADEAKLTSFAGLVIFQNLFSRLGIKQRLRQCFGHLRRSATYRGHEIRRAGRLIRPQGRLTLVVQANIKLREELELYAVG